MKSERLNTEDGVELRTAWQPGPGSKPDGPVLVNFTAFRVRGFRHLFPVIRTATAYTESGAPAGAPSASRSGSGHSTEGSGPFQRGEREEDLERWIGSDDHRDAVRANKAHMWNIASASWETDRFVLTDAWEEAERRQRAVEDDGVRAKGGEAVNHEGGLREG
jgi:hypothetical protein